MILNCGPTLAERIKARQEYVKNWHNFFCILPRRVGPNQCAWLQTIERKGSVEGYYTSCWVWEYRLKELK